MAWRPSIDTLELLVAVIDEGSVTAGARKMGMLQPNASRTLRGLEQNLEVLLFTRTPHGSQPTDKGIALAEASRSLLREAENFDASLSDIAAGKDVPLDVAASLTIGENLIAEWVTLLREEKPDLNVRIHVHHSAHVVELVREGEIELGFVEGLVPLRGLHSTPVSNDYLVMVVSPDHPWAHRCDPITPELLAQTPIVLHELGAGARGVLARELAGLEKAEPAMVVNTNTAVKAAARAGVAPAVLSILVVQEDLASGDLVAVPTERLNLSRELSAVWRPGQRPRGAAGRLVVHAKNASQLKIA